MSNTDRRHEQSLNARACAPLRCARQALYAITGGSIGSGDVRAARLTTEQRTEYFRSAPFRDWVAYEIENGRTVLWPKDVDKTQGSGDVFTFFLKWRLDNGKFSREQEAAIASYLLQRQHLLKRAASHVVLAAWSLPGLVGLHPALPSFTGLSLQDAFRLWKQQEAGGEGLSLFELWQNVYWPSQVGMTRAEKLAQVNAFAPSYAANVYPGVREENLVLTEAGVEVVIVTNGDQELATAIAPILGIKPENVVGSRLLYEDDFSTGTNHSYEVFHPDWAKRPQPGKSLFFHYWLVSNRARWGWEHLDEERFVIAGRDGDSASADGGMMIYLPTPALGNFMIDTPGEPERLSEFQAIASKYGWTRGKFFTLVQQPSLAGRYPA